MRGNKAYIALAIVAVLLLAFFAYKYFTREKEQKFNWFENYDLESEEPYGLDIFAELMESYIPNHEFEIIKEQISEIDLADEKGANYIIVSGGLYLHDEDMDELLDFVDEGNTAFLIVTHLPPELQNKLFRFYVTESYDYALRANANFYHPDLKSSKDYEFQYRFYEKDISYSWAFYDEEIFRNIFNDSEPLGYFGDERVNFMRLPYGDGYLYIHSNPIMFTNFYLIQKRLVSYAESVLAHMPEGDVFLDDFHSKPYFEMDPYESEGPSVGPLDYILSQMSLAWAFYLILGLSLTYILFQSKRKQRIIPVLFEKSNTSLEFIETIGLLYFQQKKHHKLVAMQWKQWLAYVRDRYRIQTREINDKFIKQLSQKAKLGEGEIKSIVETYNQLAGERKVSAEQLTRFYQLLENFYQKTN